jgi:hypothetical protein
MAFVILTFIAAMVISLVVWVVIGRFGVVGFGGGAYNVMPFAVVPGLAMPGGGKGSETDSMIDAPLAASIPSLSCLANCGDV